MARSKIQSLYTPMEAGSRIASVGDLSVAHTRAALTIGHPLLRAPDGTALYVRIRALSFNERREALNAARRPDGSRDDELWALQVCWRGIVEPVLTWEQALQFLGGLNYEITDYLVECITTRLSHLSPIIVEQELAALAGQSIPAADSAATTARRKRTAE
jgi:hypothetical protein